MHKGLPINEKAPSNQRTINLTNSSDLKRVHSVEITDESVKVPRTEVIGDEEEETLEELVGPEKVKDDINKDVSNEDIINEIKEAKEQIMSSLNRMQKSNLPMERLEETEHEQEDDLKHKLSKARNKFEVANVHTELEYHEEKDCIYCKLCFNPEKESPTATIGAIGARF